MPDFWPHFVSGADLGNPWADLFHISHSHPLGGVDEADEEREEMCLLGFMKFDLLNTPTIGHNYF